MSAVESYAFHIFRSFQRQPSQVTNYVSYPQKIYDKKYN